VPPVIHGCGIAKAVLPWQHENHAFYTALSGVMKRSCVAVLTVIFH
jgi:hypothetical protein